MLHASLLLAALSACFLSPSVNGLPSVLTSCETAIEAMHELSGFESSFSFSLQHETMPERSLWTGGVFDSAQDLWESSPRVLSIAHSDWEGVRSAAYATGLAVLETQGVKSESHLIRFLRFFHDAPAALEGIIFQGIPQGSLELAAWLACKGSRPAPLPPLRVYFVWHGGPSNLWHAEESFFLNKLMETSQAERGIVSGVGFAKRGLSRSYRAASMPLSTISNFPVLPQWLPTPEGGALARPLRVGIIGSGVHKNIVSQVVAACALSPPVEVFVTELPIHARAYVVKLCALPLRVIGHMGPAVFSRFLASMDLISYVSLAEGMPMVVVEASSLGVAALTSATSYVFDADPHLFELLVVQRHDEPDFIAEKMATALQERHALRPKLRALAVWLHAKATQEWCSFIPSPANASYEESQRLGPDCAGGDLMRFSSLAVSTSTPPQSLPRGDAGLSLNAAASLTSEEKKVDENVAPPLPKLPRLAFVALELAPGGPGGAGAVTAGLIIDSLVAGHCVTVIALVDTEALATWTTWASATAAVTFSENWRQWADDSRASTAPPPFLACLRTMTVADAVSNAFLHHDYGRGKKGDRNDASILWPPASADINIHAHQGWGDQRRASRDGWASLNDLQTSQAVALAAAVAYAEEPFDAIELPDYGGAAFDLLWARSGRSVFLDGNDTLKESYLPSHVLITIRAHGTFQLIDQATASEPDLSGLKHSPFPPPATRFRYYLERFALSAADAVLLPPSARVREMYVEAYGLSPMRAMSGPLPFETILHSLSSSSSRSNTHALDRAIASKPSEERQKKMTSLCPAGIVMLLGRFHLVKGTIDALLAAKDVLSQEPGICFEFVGGSADSYIDEEVGTMGHAVALLVPAHLQNRIFLSPSFDRPELASICVRARLLVFPSRFETFGLLAREALAACPLVPFLFSDAPGFADVEAADNRISFFKKGDLAGSILKRLFTSEARERNTSFTSSFFSKSAAPPTSPMYEELVGKIPINLPLFDTALLETAMHHWPLHDIIFVKREDDKQGRREEKRGDDASRPAAAEVKAEKEEDIAAKRAAPTEENGAEDFGGSSEKAAKERQSPLQSISASPFLHSTPSSSPKGLYTLLKDRPAPSISILPSAVLSSSSSSAVSAVAAAAAATVAVSKYRVLELSALTFASASISVFETPSATPSVLPTPSATPSVLPTPSNTPSVYPTPSASPSVFATPTSSTSSSVSASVTLTTLPTPTPSVSATPSVLPTPSNTPSVYPTPSVSPSVFATPTSSSSSSVTASVTTTAFPTPSVSPTAFATPSISPSVTLSVMPTPSPSISASASPSMFVTPTPSVSFGSSLSSSNSISATQTVFRTPSQTVSATFSSSPAASSSVSPSISPSLPPGPPNAADSSASSFLSTGAIAGYSVGLVALGAAVALAVLCLCRKQRCCRCLAGGTRSAAKAKGDAPPKKDVELQNPVSKEVIVVASSAEDSPINALPEPSNGPSAAASSDKGKRVSTTTINPLQQQQQQQQQKSQSSPDSAPLAEAINVVYGTTATATPTTPPGRTHAVQFFAPSAVSVHTNEVVTQDSSVAEDWSVPRSRKEGQKRGEK